MEIKEKSKEISYEELYKKYQELQVKYNNQTLELNNLKKVIFGTKREYTPTAEYGATLKLDSCKKSKMW